MSYIKLFSTNIHLTHHTHTSHPLTYSLAAFTAGLLHGHTINYDVTVTVIRGNELCTCLRPGIEYHIVIITVTCDYNNNSHPLLTGNWRK